MSLKYIDLHKSKDRYLSLQFDYDCYTANRYGWYSVKINQPNYLIENGGSDKLLCL